MSSSKFITIEGIEGAGKSTAIKFVQEYLLNEGKDVVVTREPGGTPVAEEIRQLVLNPNTKEVIDPKAELLLMFAGRAQHLARLIQPELTAGKWVVCDRFVDATYAYQSAGRGLDAKWITLLEEFVVGSLRPDLTLLLDLDPALGLARSKRRQGRGGIQVHYLHVVHRQPFRLQNASSDGLQIGAVECGKALAPQVADYMHTTGFRHGDIIIQPAFGSH